MHLKSTIYESTLSTAVRSPFPNGEGYETRIPLSPYCHFERKREIFFVRGQAKDVRIAASWKHSASSESEGRCFMQTALRKKTEEGNEKDPSAALGMTKRGNASFHSFSTCCGSHPPPRCARQPLPKEGARVDTPSFLWGRLLYEDGSIPDIKPSFGDVSILFSCRLRS